MLYNQIHPMWFAHGQWLVVIRIETLDIVIRILFQISCLGKTMLKIRRGEIIFDQFRWSNG